MTGISRDFQYVSTPIRLFYGDGCLSRLGAELDRLNCSRAAVFCSIPLTGGGAPLLARVQEALGERFAGVFTGILAHSPISAVLTATEELRRLKADAVVALGGGSAIVTARAASILLAEGGDVRSLCTVRDDKGGLKSPRLNAAKLPQFIVSTTPNTAVVKAGSAVFDPDTGERLALFDPKTRAQALFVDPVMLASAPAGLVASAALNTFATSVEGLISRQGNPMADALLMHAVRLMHQGIRRLPGGDDAALRGDLALGAVLCGQGTDHTGAGITTVLGHAIGARHEVDNGKVNAIVMPHVLRYNAEAAATGLAKVAAAMGLPEAGPEATLEAIQAEVRNLFAAVKAPQRLRDLGVSAESLPEISVASMADWFLGGNPRRVGDAGELLQILEQSW